VVEYCRNRDEHQPQKLFPVGPFPIIERQGAGKDRDPDGLPDHQGFRIVPCCNGFADQPGRRKAHGDENQGDDAGGDGRVAGPDDDHGADKTNPKGDPAPGMRLFTE